jgi:multidrug efflux pump subunit AcrB
MNVLLFIGAWSTTKVPMVAFEIASMGPVFAFVRLGLSLVGITLIALVTQKAIGKEEIAAIYERAEER